MSLSSMSFKVRSFPRYIFSRQFLFLAFFMVLPTLAFTQNATSVGEAHSPASETSAVASANAAEAESEASSTTAPKAQQDSTTGNTKPSDYEPPSIKLERYRLAFYSLYFTTAPLAGLVLILILTLHFGRPETKEAFKPFFGDGQITQLVVIIIIAGNICSLAIAGIVGASEVAAIYGGIVGYILGKKSSTRSRYDDPS